MIEGSRLLKVMMEDFRSPIEQARQIKDVEHVGDGITHDIARRLNKTFITPIDRVPLTISWMWRRRSRTASCYTR
jgi:uncharacterized protein Yka (UPF0111/DUF47 family)